jgi:hypothetical protein
MSADWRTYLLADLGAPVTPTNLAALNDWARSEGTPSSWNNPLATTLTVPGSVSVNSTGVKRYPSQRAGAEALAHTLLAPAYKPVVAALRAGNDRHAIWQAINQSPWCAGCQKGQYPETLSGGASGANTTTTSTTPTPTPPEASSNPLTSPHAKQTALKDLLYVVLAAAGAGLLWIGVKRTTGPETGGA